MKKEYNIFVVSKNKPELKTVSGEPVKFFHPLNLKFFIHRRLDIDTRSHHKKWMICEYSTGLAIATGKTKQKAIEHLKSIPYFNDYSLNKKLQKTMNDNIKKHGIANQ